MQNIRAITVEYSAESGSSVVSTFATWDAAVDWFMACYRQQTGEAFPACDLSVDDAEFHGFVGESAVQYGFTSAHYSDETGNSTLILAFYADSPVSDDVLSEIETACRDLYGTNDVRIADIRQDETATVVTVEYFDNGTLRNWESSWGIVNGRPELWAD